MKPIDLSNYSYILPAEKIAAYGLQKRDESKLLFFSKDQIEHRIFRELPDLLPEQSSLFFNNTKVIQARLKLKRKTGAVIEVFLLAPEGPQDTIAQSLSSTKPVLYQCMIGNLKKWKNEEILDEIFTIGSQKICLKAELVNRNTMTVRFSWDNDLVSFFEIIEVIGHTPLPPYIHREDEPNDKGRYQTVYSRNPGAVAAPTAGLHFTPEVLEELTMKGAILSYLTLHVSAGTFQPIKVKDITEHPMHSERMIINRKNVEDVIAAKTIVAVGTTALRTLESTYWYGVQLLQSGNAEFMIKKLVPYEHQNNNLPSRKDSFNAVLAYMKKQNIEEISGDTEIFIFPGYTFQVCDALITNFHQPGSTLILLIAAFVGENWRKIYQQALDNNYRFLSYGDSSLLLKSS